MKRFDPREIEAEMILLAPLDALIDDKELMRQIREKIRQIAREIFLGEKINEVD